MCSAIRFVVKDYGWIHTGLGLLGNILFFVGSILFLPAFEALRTIGVWLFISGSFFMLIGAVGELGVKFVDRR